MARRFPLVALVGALAVLACTSRAAAADAPRLTEVERLQVEVLTLKAQLARAIADGDACRVELAPTRSRLNALVVTADANTLAAAIEAAHPGTRVNRETWQLEATTPPPKGSPR